MIMSFSGASDYFQLRDARMIGRGTSQAFSPKGRQPERQEVGQDSAFVALRAPEGMFYCQLEVCFRLIVLPKKNANRERNKEKVSSVGTSSTTHSYRLPSQETLPSSS